MGWAFTKTLAIQNYFMVILTMVYKLRLEQRFRQNIGLQYFCLSTYHVHLLEI